ncbi:rhodanese-like domain-containing protein [Curtanaerobium respiraculi]|uniref:rhodanese-like domain-containing protein n=1 Tax=Curtanaerobium respiraculi TaxID=2949669 RepID=UPI0024B34C5A|nr:rhodanese-like domain-containing protein [Curtanaerobium respiraculi]
MARLLSERARLRPGIARDFANLCIEGAVLFAIIAVPGCTNSEPDISNGVSESSPESTVSTQSVPSSEETNSLPDSAYITVNELHDRLQAENPPTVIDIRSKGDYLPSFIADSKNIPAGRQFELRMDEIPSDKPIVLIALSESGTADAYEALMQAGYSPENVKIAQGGINA